MAEDETVEVIKGFKKHLKLDQQGTNTEGAVRGKESFFLPLKFQYSFRGKYPARSRKFGADIQKTEVYMG